MRTFYLSFLFFLLSLISYSQIITNEGTDFWIAFQCNLGMSATLTICISSNDTASGTITSTYPGVTQSFTVVPGIVTQVTVPPGVAMTEGIEDKGIRVTSDHPICVYGLNHRPASTDAYLALPVNALGLDYWIMAYSTWSSAYGYGTDVAVVATQDSTSLIIYNHQTGDTSYVNLNQGQTYDMNETGINMDLTGSRVQSNHPVGVFGSNRCAEVPNAFCQSCDHLTEMMFPWYSWGKTFVTIPTAGRNNSVDAFRVLAGDDNTDVSINGSLVATLNAGDYYQAVLTGNNSFVASKAVLLAQYAVGETCSGSATGDPFMMLIPPMEQFLTNYTVINTPGGFDTHWINVVAPDYALGSIYQDGVIIPSSSFTPIPSTNYWGAQRSVTAGSHTFNSTFPFGVFVYGWGNFDSYGYPGGGSIAHLGTVHGVTLSPDTAYGQLNVTSVCMTAHVTDNYLNPVVGVLVNFNISGVNPIIGNGYTNLTGDATYCYTQFGSIPGTDQVYAEVFGYKSDTSLVFWSNNPPCADPTNGGTISNDQTSCGGFTPSTLNNMSFPTGYTGNPEYKWQFSTTGSTTGFIDIAGSNTASYSPGFLSQTTWFKRRARVDCKPDWIGSAESNVLQMTVTPTLPVTVAINASEDTVCEGTQVTYTALPVNGGSFPSFIWKVNGINSGGNNPVFTYTPLNGDVINCVLTSDATCPTGNPATSNSVTMTVNPNLAAGILISSSSNPYCPGESVTFTSTTVNGGLSPQYHWKVNGIDAGSNSTTYIYNPANGDQVSCSLNSSIACPITNPVTSNVISMIQNNSLPAAISITASQNPFCPGSSVTFTATPGNGGTNPSYQWKVNGINVGTNSNTYSYNPVDGDSVRCILYSNLPCVTNNPVSSSKIILSGTLAPIVTFSACFDTITTVSAKPIKLKGGIPLDGVYSGAGVSAGIFNPAVAGIGTKTITYSYTNAYLCNASKIKIITVQAAGPFICGNTLTDIRDNRSYPTVQIGSQCWMAANLNSGMTNPGMTNQRDNCIAEKYCYNDIPINCNLYGGLYQWDELMQYEETPGVKGMCPPGWHIPTESEWSTLFANWVGNGFAGSPLKYSGFSGFNALLSGVGHGNVQWGFPIMTTFFWTSTENGPFRAWAHGMNDYDPSVSVYSSLKSNAFSVRCLCD